MESFKISDLLEIFNKISNRVKCKTCSVLVSWNRDRVASHKRINCTNVSQEERIFFAKKRRIDDSFSENSNDSTSSQQSSFGDIDAAVANLFYRSGISFRIADSPAWKQLISLLNANYALVMPSSKVLSSRLLDKQCNKTRAKIGKILCETESLTLTSDGWTNVRGDHIVNFIIKAPNRQPFFFKPINC
jgi:Protein of unknown function (DUF 659)